jgi:hypothetical protein
MTSSSKPANTPATPASSPPASTPTTPASTPASRSTEEGTSPPATRTAAAGTQEEAGLEFSDPPFSADDLAEIELADSPFYQLASKIRQALGEREIVSELGNTERVHAMDKELGEYRRAWDDRPEHPPEGRQTRRERQIQAGTGVPAAPAPQRPTAASTAAGSSTPSTPTTPPPPARTTPPPPARTTPPSAPTSTPSTSTPPTTSTGGSEGKT